MPMLPKHRPAGWTTLAAAALTGLLLSAGALAAAESSAPGAAAPAAVPSPSPSANRWWAAFEEPELDRLVQRTAATSPAAARSTPAVHNPQATLPPSAQVVLAFIGMRAYGARAALAADLADTLAQERSALAASAPTRDTGALLEEITRRQQATAAIGQHYLAQRERYAELLAQLTEAPGGQAHASLRLALTEPRLPQFHARVPARLPMALLLGRADVRLAQLEAAQWQRLSGDGAGAREAAQLLSGWITPMAPAWPAGQPTAEQPPSPLAATLTSAAEDVAQRLQLLQAAERRCAALAATVHAGELELQAARERSAAGTAGDIAVAERTARLLAEVDALVAVRTELAVAWVGLQLSLGGA
ncbi:hypothetical protein [Ideonella sp. BN130291]|uniref:hypothetical protein n=1 Tax=Ideonella sp. BN130291 TaxID=3112940 RepID=UPI002E255D52|nr:hypothetical protein [Ideonella sp. BN130291]